MNQVLDVLRAIYEEIDVFIRNLQRLSTFEKYVFLFAAFLGFQSYGKFIKSLSSTIFKTVTGVWLDVDLAFTLILIVFPICAFFIFKYVEHAEQLHEDNLFNLRDPVGWITRNLRDPVGWITRTLRDPVDWITRNFPVFNRLRWRVSVEWPDSWEAANTKVVVFRAKGVPATQLHVDVWHATELLQVTSHSDGENLHVLIPATSAGKYRFILTVGGQRLPVWERHIHPGIPDQNNCFLLGLSASTVVVASGSTFTSTLQVHDSFHNPVDCHQADAGDVAIDLGRDVASVTVGVHPTSPGLLISVKINPGVAGSYETTVKYRGEAIKGGDISVLVLLPVQERAVAKNVENINSAYWFSSGTYFKVVLLKLNGKMMKHKDVYVYVSEKLIYMKEGYLKIFNHRVPGASFRICPAVNLAVKRSNHLVISQREAQSYDTIVQSDKALEIAATYYTILQSRTGGTQTFAEKRAFFNESLVKYHERLKHKHCRMAISVSRTNLLESTLQATKYFNASNWARLFEVHFVDEVGIDEGGVRREFFEVLTRFIFDPSNGMFVPLDSDADPGCPVHPNHNPPPHIKPKHFKLAGCIVGKCLYESAMGATYRQNLNAKLSSSLLAKIIGVEPHYSMMEKDAPKLWRSKIKKIIETDSIESFGQDLGEKLKFTHEEYDNDLRPREVELVVGGAEKSVTDENKMEYISALVNYLQTKRVSKQLEMFLEGVYTLVPDAYLAMWDEADLELLLCGVKNYDVGEMRENCSVELTTSRRFDVVLEWFWLAVTHMTREDMSRLLQFCTGSSLLPPGGFKDLNPNLQLSWGRLEAGSLPVSHTCFNNLVLPDAKNYQELERVLLVAIREGGEGFLMA